MPSRRTSRAFPVHTAAAVALALCLAPAPRFSRADTPVTAPEASNARRPAPPRDDAHGRRAPARPGAEGGASWWLGPAGVALALAACGWASVAARRSNLKGPAAAAGLRVVGRTSLSPRHSVYLLQAGDRVLLVGTGPQGPPSLLGELDDFDPPAAAAPPAAPASASSPAARARFDLRVGDES